MSRHAAELAYRDSKYNQMAHEAQARIDSRTRPLVGSMVPSLKLMGNQMWRPIKVGKALILGYRGEENREMPALPEVPEAFKGSSLGEAFLESWKLKQEATKARVKTFDSAVHADLKGWLQNSSIASYAETKDSHVTFPEDSIGASFGGNSSLPTLSRSASASVSTPD